MAGLREHGHELAEVDDHLVGGVLGVADDVLDRLLAGVVLEEEIEAVVDVVEVVVLEVVVEEVVVEARSGGVGSPGWPVGPPGSGLSPDRASNKPSTRLPSQNSLCDPPSIEEAWNSPRNWNDQPRPT